MLLLNQFGEIHEKFLNIQRKVLNKMKKTIICLLLTVVIIFPTMLMTVNSEKQDSDDMTDKEIKETNQIVTSEENERNTSEEKAIMTVDADIRSKLNVTDKDHVLTVYLKSPSAFIRYESVKQLIEERKVEPYYIVESLDDCKDLYNVSDFRGLDTQISNTHTGAFISHITYTEAKYASLLKKTYPNIEIKEVCVFPTANSSIGIKFGSAVYYLTNMGGYFYSDLTKKIYTEKEYIELIVRIDYELGEYQKANNYPDGGVIFNEIPTDEANDKHLEKKDDNIYYENAEAVAAEKIELGNSSSIEDDMEKGVAWKAILPIALAAAVIVGVGTCALITATKHKK